MILKTFLTEKPFVACTTILGLILSTGWCSSTQGTNFVTFVRKVLECITPVTYELLSHTTFKVCNYIVVLNVPII